MISVDDGDGPETAARGKGQAEPNATASEEEY